jgi:hypothetical protein
MFRTMFIYIPQIVHVDAVDEVEHLLGRMQLDHIFVCIHQIVLLNPLLYKDQKFLTKVLFRCEKILDFVTIALSFVYDKYFPIMD